MLRAMTVGNHLPQASELKSSDKFIVAEEPRPQQLHLHEHRHTFNHMDKEHIGVRRRDGRYDTIGRALEFF
jgi:hypothetical protein